MSLPASLVWGRHRQEMAENVISCTNHSQMLARLLTERLSYLGPFLKPSEGQRGASRKGWQGAGRGDRAAWPSHGTEPRGPRRARGDASQGRRASEAGTRQPGVPAFSSPAPAGRSSALWKASAGHAGRMCKPTPARADRTGAAGGAGRLPPCGPPRGAAGATRPAARGP